MKTSLKTILRNFLNHVEDLDARKRTNDDQYEVEFQRLKQLTDRLREDAQYSCSHGHKEVNRPKNRYKDIVPYDFCRVILPEYSEIPGSDYINASYIKGASGACAYVAAQGPLPNTLIDFWRMIWACDVKVIIMACNQQEAGKYKCESYWPEENDPTQYGTISVELVGVNQVCVDFLLRTLSVKQQEEEKFIYQFHYTTWPDHGVPTTVYPILELVRLVRDCQASETVPIVVHCSAGCGRTGTICAIDFVWACLRSGKLNDSFCLYDIVAEMRQQRIAMVQTKEQYILIHKAVASMFEQQLRVIDCHIYENLDQDGQPLLWKGLQHEEMEKRECISSQELNGSCSLKQEIIYGTEDKSNKKDEQSSRSGISLVQNSALHASLKQNTFPNEQKKEMSACFAKAASMPYDNNRLLKSTVAEKPSNISCYKTQELSVLPTSFFTAEKSKDVADNLNSSSHESEEPIPFIDDDEDTGEDTKIRPHGGRAYINLPSDDSLSKIICRFDPFVDQISGGTDESSPEAESSESSIALLGSSGFRKPIPSDAKSDSVSLLTKTEVIHLPDNNLRTLKSAPILPEASPHTKISSDITERTRVAYSADMSDHKITPGNKKVQSNEILRPFSVETSSPAESQINVSDPENKMNKTVTFHNNNSGDSMTMESKAGGDSSVPRQIGKASVIRRPSIARLKALFEKSGTANNRGCEKRSLFRHHSHHISRAGSAPPSLDSVNRSSDIERQSLLEMVTRKFRSSSVKSERELQKDKKSSDSNALSSKKCRNSSFSNFKENIFNLKKNVSSSLFKSSAKFAPQTEWHDKPGIEPNHHVTYDKTHDEITLGSRKGLVPSVASREGTQWYDTTRKENVTKVYVKPFTNPSSSEHATGTKPAASAELDLSHISSKSDVSCSKHKGTQPLNVPTRNPVVVSPTDTQQKLNVPLLSIMSRTDPKETSALWYSSGDDSNASTISREKPTTKNSEATSIVSKEATELNNDVERAKSDADKDCKSEITEPQVNELGVHLAKSKFYMSISSKVDKPPVLPMKKRVSHSVYDLLPEEAKPSSEPIVSGNSKFFWPSNSFASSHDQGIKLNPPNIAETVKEAEELSSCVECVNIEEPVICKVETVSCIPEPMHPVYIKNIVPDGQIDKRSAKEAPPALPKKMLVGKNRNIDSLLDAEEGKSVHPTAYVLKVVSSELPPSSVALDSQIDKGTKCGESEDKNISPTSTNGSDVYMNVNITAKKNIEQIENTLRNHPRGAIIDLTSRQSYSMEEELALAVKELSAVKKPVPPFRTAMDAKLAGYEVIWPESKQGKPIKSTLVKKNESTDVVRTSGGASFNKSDLSQSLQPGDLLESLNQGKNVHQVTCSRTGLCYSPPLRRNVSSSFSLSKSQSCVTLDWEELEKRDIPAESRLSVSEKKSTETLVSEAVVELTTLLDELTTRTLSEDADINNKSSPELAEVSSPVIQADSVSCNSDPASDKPLEMSDRKNKFETQNDKQSKSAARDNSDAFAIAIKPLSFSRNPKDEEIVFHFPPPPPIPPPPQDELVEEVFDVRCQNGKLLISEGSKEECDLQEKNVAEAYIQTDSSKQGVIEIDQSKQAPPLPLPRRAKQASFTESGNSSKVSSVSPKSGDLASSSEGENVLLNLKLGEPVKTSSGDATKPASTAVSLGNPAGNDLPSNEGAFQCGAKSKNSDNRLENMPNNFADPSAQGLVLGGNATAELLCSSQPNSQSSSAQTVFQEENVCTSTTQLSLKMYDLNKESTTESSSNNAQLSRVVPPRYENVSLVKSEIQCTKQDSSSKDSSSSVESLNISAGDTALKNVLTAPQCDRFIQMPSEISSIYGKIKKVPPNRICAVAPMQLKENIPTGFHENNQSCRIDEKKRPPPSRKSERAPLPPSVRPRSCHSDEKGSSLKRLPSRKLERAPQPPVALSTSASCVSLAPSSKSETWNVQFTQNTHSQTPHLKQKLHALYENISEMHSMSPDCKPVDSMQNTKESSDSPPSLKAGYALKHSHSDASVFLALRGNKLKHSHPKQKPPEAKQTTEALTDRRKGSSGTSEGSSDDSESSLRQIVLSAQIEGASEQQNSTSRRLKKDMPVAPPRSKRRSTMEIHYMKKPDLKEKADPSKPLSLPEQAELDDTQTSTVIIEDAPPAIPMKTKEAFEVPEEFRHKAITLPHQKDINIILNKGIDCTSKETVVMEKVADNKPTPVLLRREVAHRESPTSIPLVRKVDYKRRSIPAVATLPRTAEVNNLAPRKPLQ